MNREIVSRLSKWIFYVALAFVVYMPLHVFIVQSASLLTGGLEEWELGKDIVLAVSIPVLVYFSYSTKLLRSKDFLIVFVMCGLYGLIHLLYVLFNDTIDTYSAMAGSLFNVRIFGYMLLGILVAYSAKTTKHIKVILTAMILIATAVSIFGVMQYFLPSDLLTHVGYSVERGVKPLFFIDDNTDLPRIMSTIKDPNSFGSYLLLPIVLSMVAIYNAKFRKAYASMLHKKYLVIALLIQLIALFLTFSRGALLSLIIAVIALLFLFKYKTIATKARQWGTILALILIVLPVGAYQFRDTQFVKDYILHAAETSEDSDPNEKRILLFKSAAESVVDEPLGHGPGTAGLIAISSPNGGILTENYPLQIAYEVGWLGAVLFIAINIKTALIIIKSKAKERSLVIVFMAAFAAYVFNSNLIHLWSNEAVALQWWLFVGLLVGLSIKNMKQERQQRETT